MLNLVTVIAINPDNLIKHIDALNSSASSRDIINKNFDNLRKAIIALTGFNFTDLNGLNFPNPPLPNIFYSLVYNNNSWNLQESPLNYGTKYRLNAGDNFTVQTDYQYIIHDNLILNGGSLTLNPGAELVIF